MAYYAAAGAHVTLVTCTLGEVGEILIPELAQLAFDQADQLGGYRLGELATAMQCLGVSDHRYLGGPGRWRDSGMVDTPENAHPRAFWQCASDSAAFDAAVDQLVAVIREIRPQVVVTYDEHGGYGHPDHIMAHRVAMSAVDRAADAGGDGEPWAADKVYWTALPKSVLMRSIELIRDAPNSPFATVQTVDDLPFGNDDDEITTCIDAAGFGDAKMAAMAAHASQISLDGPFFALSNNLGNEVMAQEYFRLVKGNLAGERDAEGREIDLFAGVVE